MSDSDKNWLWRGDDLWFQRWQQAISLDRKPDYIQIISWNDFGESHYIGPLDDRQYEAFGRGRAPYNYVEDMPHDGWRETLNYYISMYKEGSALLNEERLVSWFRIHKNGICSDGGTTGNTGMCIEITPLLHASSLRRALFPSPIHRILTTLSQSASV